MIPRRGRLALNPHEPNNLYPYDFRFYTLVGRGTAWRPADRGVARVRATPVPAPGTLLAATPMEEAGAARRAAAYAAAASGASGAAAGPRVRGGFPEGHA